MYYQLFINFVLAREDMTKAVKLKIMLTIKLFQLSTIQPELLLKYFFVRVLYFVVTVVSLKETRIHFLEFEERDTANY